MDGGRKYLWVSPTDNGSPEFLPSGTLNSLRLYAGGGQSVQCVDEAELTFGVQPNLRYPVLPEKTDQFKFIDLRNSGGHDTKQKLVNHELVEDKAKCRELGVTLNSDLKEEEDDDIVCLGFQKPTVVHAPVEGKVLHGSSVALKKLLEPNQIPKTKDTGITLEPGFSKISTKDQRYEEGEDYTILSKFGKGAFGEVFLVEDTGTKSIMILKQQSSMKLYAQEMLVQSSLSHPAFIKINSVIWRSGGRVETFMNFGGFSFDKVVQNETMRPLLTEGAIMNIGYQGFDAAAYLARQGIMHLDLKPQNLLLVWDTERNCFHLTFCDFGACKHENDPIQPVGWTAAYMSVEQCRAALHLTPSCYNRWTEKERKITPQSDVYSFSHSLLYLCYWKHCLVGLFPGEDNMKMITHVAYNPTVLRQFVQQHWDPRLKKVLLESFCEADNRIRPLRGMEILSDVNIKAVGAVKERAKPKLTTAVLGNPSAEGPSEPPREQFVSLNGSKMQVGVKRAASEMDPMETSCQQRSSGEMDVGWPFTGKRMRVEDPMSVSPEEDVNDGNIPELNLLLPSD